MTAAIRLACLLFSFVLLDASFALSTEVEADNDKYEREVVNINKLFDDALPVLRDHIVKSGLDPIRMSNLHQHLDAPISNNNYISLTKGWMQGLSSLKRNGDVSISYNDKILQLDMNLGLDVLAINYEYELKYSLVWRTGGFRGRFDGVDLRVQLMVDFQNYRIILNSIRVNCVKKITVGLEGHLVDNILNIALKAIVGIFKENVIQTVEDRSYDVFQDFLDELNSRIPRPAAPARSEYDSLLKNVPVVFEYYKV